MLWSDGSCCGGYRRQTEVTVARKLGGHHVAAQPPSQRSLMKVSPSSDYFLLLYSPNQGSQNNMGFDMLMSMFRGLGASGIGVPNVPDVAPEQLYATQPSQLQEMGFFDVQENIRVLCATSGNVHVVVERGVL
ncbi:unnamed protein product [Lactuca saligna]|uniref:UBA domain-containing protein n=1 Tax=Lactuca saligna TaxID=75948 RepID=A0AA35YGX3_LACSI|nr:unnamed protein product [Lactuca saligna]